MNKRLAKVNRHIQRTLGEILLTEADIPRDTLVTISRVETTPNLRSTTVWVYISPLEQADSVISILKQQLYDIQGELNRRLAMKPLPRIKLILDNGAEHSQQIDQTLAELERREEE